MKILNDKSIVTFCGKTKDTIGVVLGLDQLMRAPEKVAHGALFEFDAEFAKELQFLELPLVSVAYLDDDETLVALSENGDIRLYGTTGLRSESFEPSLGPMRAVKLIGTKLFASGVSAQFFSREGDGTWTDISPPRATDSSLRSSIVESIDGFAENDIYGAGENGVIWRFDGENWAAVQTATNLAYYAIHCADNGVVYAVGQLGILARGRGDSFEIVPQNKEFADLWGVRLFEDALYTTSMRAMLTLEDDELVPVLPAMELAMTFYGLDVVDGVLWSAGEKDIIRFDGSKWSRFVDPEWV
ncbi:MAG: hypothetical protein AAF848_13670 [Pseudomonadota bacterium]